MKAKTIVWSVSANVLSLSLSRRRTHRLIRNALLIIGVLTVLFPITSSLRAATNVALGKPVTLFGAFGSAPLLAPTLTDGEFRPKDTFWQDGTVWWNGNESPGNSIVIDLGGSYTIDSLIVQADDNDAYILDYLDSSNVWQRAWDVPNYDFEPFGMQTRPNPLDDTERYFLPVPIIATAFRFYGNDDDSDRLYAVSEIQAYQIPEPTSLALATAGAALLAGLTWRRAKPRNRGIASDREGPSLAISGAEGDRLRP